MTNQQGAPEALPDPSPDQLRAIARTARNSSGSASDDCGPLAYVLHGWRAAAIAFRAQQAALVEAQQPACDTARYCQSVQRCTAKDETRAQQPAPSAAALVEGGRVTQAGHNLLMAATRASATLVHAGRMATDADSPTPQADSAPSAASKAVLAAIRAANMQLVRTGDDEFMLVTFKQATPQADSQPAKEAPCRIFLVTQHHSKDGKLQPRYGASLFKVLSAHGTFDTAERAREDAENAYHALYPGYKQDGVQPFYSWVVQEMEVAPTSAARAPADSVTAPAGCNNIPGMAEKALAKLKSHIDHVAHKDGHWETRHLKDALFDLEWIVRRKLTPTPPAQAADSVLEDAARLNWLQANSCDLRCIGVPTGGDDYDINWVVIEHYQAEPHEREIGRSYQDDPRAAIDAARKQGANHDNA